jgi:site-specific recombinase XerD
MVQEDTTLPADQAGVFIKQVDRVSTVRDVKSTQQPRGRQIISGELAALMPTCEKDLNPAGVRDEAMLALTWATGARRAEIATLTLADFVLNGEGSGDLLNRGKGGKVRLCISTTALFLPWLTSWAHAAANPARFFVRSAKETGFTQASPYPVKQCRESWTTALNIACWGAGTITWSH